MYCVNCGVKLADSEERCPLCATRVYHPDLPRPQGERLYPADTYPAPQVSSWGAQIITTALFLLPMLICLQCDYQLNRGVVWSGYVIGGLILGYVLFVLPYWFRKTSPAVFCGCDFLAAGLYLMYINWKTGGNWFFTFALPVTAAVGVLVTAMVALLRYIRRGALYIVGSGIGALGGFMPVMELLLCAAFPDIPFRGWSMYPLIALVLLGGTLIFLGVNHRAREKMERKFFI